MGGAGAKPYDLTESFKPMGHDKGEGLYRRSVYTFWKRTGPAPVMMALDAAKRDVCRAKRENPATPLQALVLLNGPQFVQAAGTRRRAAGPRPGVAALSGFGVWTPEPSASKTWASASAPTGRSACSAEPPSLEVSGKGFLGHRRCRRRGLFWSTPG